jgi:hypothetical protein
MVSFTAAHAADTKGWPDTDWPVAHTAAIAWRVIKASEPLILRSGSR